MRGGQELLCPRLHGEGSRGGEDGGDKQSDQETEGPVNPWMLEQRHADRHEDGAEADLEKRELLEGNARREMGEGQHMQRKA